MPQLDRFTFLTQFFWLFTLLALAYYLLVGRILPSLYAALRFRTLRVTSLRSRLNRLAASEASVGVVRTLLGRSTATTAVPLNRLKAAVVATTLPLRLSNSRQLSLPLLLPPVTMTTTFLFRLLPSLSPLIRSALFPLLPILLPSLIAGLVALPVPRLITVTTVNYRRPPPTFLVNRQQPVIGRILPALELVRSLLLYGELVTLLGVVPPIHPLGAAVRPPLVGSAAILTILVKGFLLPPRPLP